MPTSDNAHHGHGILRTVLITLAAGVLLASVVMGWYVHQADDGSAMTGPAATADTGVSRG